MKIGIVILNYNTPDLTIALASTCLKIKKISSIVVVDNDSKDESSKILRAKLDVKIHFIQLNSNLGYARGNNVGLKKLVELGCDICIISNPDVKFSSELIQAIEKEFEDHSEYGIITTARKMEDCTLRIRQYWSFPSIRELILENFSIYVHRKKRSEIYIPKATSIYDIEVAPGAFFAIRTTLLKEINYLDENTFLYFEENCLSAKIKKTEYRIGFIPYIYYTCIDRNKNSTASIQKTTTSRKYYIKSKEYFAQNYLHIKRFESVLLKATDQIFIFEKWISIRIKRMMGE